MIFFSIYVSVCTLFSLTSTVIIPVGLAKTIPELYWLNYATDHLVEDILFQT